MNPDSSQHLMTVNLEDYFQVQAFNKFIQRNRWQRFESRIEHSTDQTLALLERFETRATFFVLGWIASEFPKTIRKIADAGHEVAVRGFYHRGIRDMTPEEFTLDARRAREAVEAASGRRSWGYRLADGWIGEDDLWALNILAQLGFAYDSSIAPIRRVFQDEPLRHRVHRHDLGDTTIMELPISCKQMLGIRMPVAGGNYLRQLPRGITRRAAARWVREETTPLVAYFQSWELDTEQPRLSAGGMLTQLRHYRNLDQMKERLAELLRSYRFGTCQSYLQLPELMSNPCTTPSSLIDTKPEVVLVSAEPDLPRQPISIVIPVYNEELLVPHLANTLEEVRQKLSTRYEVQFVLVNDGSKDKTWPSLQKAFKDKPGYTIVQHDINLGVSAAIMTGIKCASTEVVCSMDCDCSYDPLTFQELIPLLTAGVDLVTASPYHPQGEVRNVPGWRLLLSRGAAWLYRRVLRTKLHTYTSCFRVYRRSVVAAIPLKHNRFLGVAELIGKMDLEDRKIVEHPAVLEVRMLGRSKMKTVSTVLGHLGLLTRLAWLRLKKNWTTAPRDQVLKGQIALLERTQAQALNDTPAPYPTPHPADRKPPFFQSTPPTP